MLNSTIGSVKESTTAPLVAAVPIRIANGIAGAAIHVLSKLDVMCLNMKMYRMLIVHQ